MKTDRKITIGQAFFLAVVVMVLLMSLKYYNSHKTRYVKINTEEWTSFEVPLGAKYRGGIVGDELCYWLVVNKNFDKRILIDPKLPRKEDEDTGNRVETYDFALAKRQGPTKAKIFLKRIN